MQVKFILCYSESLSSENLKQVCNFEKLGGDGNIRQDIRISAKENLGHYKLQQHKPWFNEECSELQKDVG
jgi:hypothetical protein